MKCYHRRAQGAERDTVFRLQFHTCTIHGAQLWFGKGELDEACTGMEGEGLGRGQGKALLETTMERVYYQYKAFLAVTVKPVWNNKTCWFIVVVKRSGNYYIEPMCQNESLKVNYLIV